jgi:hypothetical protein
LDRLPKRASPHTTLKGAAKPLPERVFENTQGAGSIYSSGADALKWLRLHLGETRKGEPGLIRPETLRELHRPHTLLQREEMALMHRPPKAQFAAYAMGWFVTDFAGRRLVQHSGGMFGWFAHMALAPDTGLGVAVYMNARKEVHHAIAYTVIERLLGEPPRDWGEIAETENRTYRRKLKALVRKMLPVEDGAQRPKSLAPFEGRYVHPAAGAIEVERSSGGLVMKQLDGRLWDLSLDPIGGEVFEANFVEPVIAEYAPDGFRARFRMQGGAAVALEEPNATYARQG